MMRVVPRSLRQTGNTAAVSLLVLLLASCAMATVTAQPVGLQSPAGSRAGSTFVSSVAYRPTLNAVLLTGSTYSNAWNASAQHPGCFLGQVSLGNAAATWSYQQQLTAGYPDYDSGSKNMVHELCTSLFVVPEMSKLFVAGSSQYDGSLLDDLFQWDDSVVAGMVLDMDLTNLLEPGNPVPLLGGVLQEDEEVSYPVAMVGLLAGEGPYLFTVAMESTDNTQHPMPTSNMDVTADLQHGLLSVTDQANWAPLRQNLNEQVNPVQYYQYGSNYQMVLNSYQYHPNGWTPPATTAATDDTTTEIPQTLTKAWRQVYDTDNTEDDIIVSAMTVVAETTSKSSDNKQHVLVVVGTTTGTGAAFGGSDGTSTTTRSTTSTGTDYDGFVTLINAATGKLWTNSNDDDAASSYRFETGPGQDDFVSGVCVLNTAHFAAGSADYFYVVGGAAGTLPGSTPLVPSSADTADDTTEGSTLAFIAKMSLATLQPVWIKQLGATAGAGSVSSRPLVSHAIARGMACDVTPDGAFVYLAGDVLNGAVLPNQTSSWGGDDVFVAQLSAETGELQWLKQVGTNYHDALAMRGGGVLSDVHGNAIVTGNTYGSLYRNRNADTETTDITAADVYSDVFVMTFSKTDGSYAPTLSPQPSATGDNNLAPQNDAPNPKDASSAGVSPDKYNRNYMGMKLWALYTVLLVACSVIVMALAWYAYSLHAEQKGSHKTIERTKVLRYLNGFDVDDIDLKHSATGGWHCSYSNDLCKGINRKAERDEEFSTTSNLKLMTGTGLGGVDENETLIESLFIIDDMNDPDGPRTATLSKVAERPVTGRVTGDLGTTASAASRSRMGDGLAAPSSGGGALNDLSFQEEDETATTSSWRGLNRGDSRRSNDSSGRKNGTGEWGGEII